MTFKVAGYKSTGRFNGELASASPDTKRAVKKALDLLQRNPQAKTLRVHPLTGYGKPTLFKIDVFANRSWQIAFEMDGQIAILRRLATHKDIDRDPRGQ